MLTRGTRWVCATLAMPAPPSETALLVASSARGASYLMAATVVQRLLTFGLNAALIRRVSADVLGFAASDMELMTATILFLSREAPRLVALRAPAAATAAWRAEGARREGGKAQGASESATTGERRSESAMRGAGVRRSASGDSSSSLALQQLVNLAWLPVPLGAALALCAGVALRARAASQGAPADEVRAIGLYCLAALIETLAEPAYILCAAAAQWGGRARGEVAATLARCGVTFLLLAVGGAGAGAGAGAGSGGGLVAPASAFALGQLSHGLVLAAALWGHLAAAPGAPALRQLLPRLLPGGAGGAGARGRPAPLAPRSLAAALRAGAAAQLGGASAALLGPYAAAGLAKHALTEGDRLVLMALSSREQRGAFAVVSNYGSLAVRVLFAPVEEATRALMSRLLGREREAQEEERAGEPQARRAGGRAPAAAAQVLPLRGRSPGAPSSLRRRRGRTPGGESLAAGGGRSPSRVLRAVGGRSPSRAPSAVGGRRPSPAALRASSGRCASASPAPAPAALRAALRAYLSALRLVLCVGLLGASLGPPLCVLAVGSLLGRGWAASGVPPALAAFCLYALALALNGVSEAAATSAASARGLRRYSRALAALALLQAAAAAALLRRWGIPGLLAAGGLGAAARAGLCLAQLQALAARAGARFRPAQAAPGPASLGALAAAAAALAAAARALGQPTSVAAPEGARLAAAAAAAAAGVLAVMWAEDRARIARAWAVLRGREEPGGEGSEVEEGPERG